MIATTLLALIIAMMLSATIVLFIKTMNSRDYDLAFGAGIIFLLIIFFLALAAGK